MHKFHRARYDYEEIDDRDEDCLCNEFEILGRKVITVNLDDKCDLRKTERTGIFVQSGDLIIFTGSENETAGQEWEIAPFNELDESIVYLLDDFEEVL